MYARLQKSFAALSVLYDNGIVTVLVCVLERDIGSPFPNNLILINLIINLSYHIIISSAAVAVKTHSLAI